MVIPTLGSLLTDNPSPQEILATSPGSTSPTLFELVLFFYVPQEPYNVSVKSKLQHASPGNPPGF